MLPGKAALVEQPVWLAKAESVTSDQNGIFYPLVIRVKTAGQSFCRPSAESATAGR